MRILFLAMFALAVTVVLLVCCALWLETARTLGLLRLLTSAATRRNGRGGRLGRYLVVNRCLRRWR